MRPRRAAFSAYDFKVTWVSDYKRTVNLPQTDFPMKADLAGREPAQLERWAQLRIYERIMDVMRQIQQEEISVGRPESAPAAEVTELDSELND